MAITGSGQVSLSDIQTEFGGSNPIGLSEYYDEGNAPASGEIQLAADFYGTSSMPAFSTATGGTIATSGDYKIHSFTSNGTFEITEIGVANTVEYLIVGGGGGGGNGVGTGYAGGGGGGADGVVGVSAGA